MVVTLASARLLAPPARAAPSSGHRTRVVAAAPSRASRRVRLQKRFSPVRLSRGRDEVLPPSRAARRNPNEIEELDIDAMGAPGRAPARPRATTRVETSDAAWGVAMAGNARARVEPRLESSDVATFSA